MSKILIIEDEAPIRRVLTKILSEENDSYLVQEAEDGLQGSRSPDRPRVPALGRRAVERVVRRLRALACRAEAAAECGARLDPGPETRSVACCSRRPITRSS